MCPTLVSQISNVSFFGEELFVNVSGLSYNSDSFLRIGLQSTVAPVPLPVPLPAGLPFLVGGLACLFGLSRLRQSRSNYSIRSA